MNSCTVDLIVEGYFADREQRLKPTIKDKSDLKLIIETLVLFSMDSGEYEKLEYGWNNVKGS